MKRLRLLLLPVTCLVACMVAWLPVSAVGQQNTSSMRGLDVVVLVDISRSMRHFNPKSGQPESDEELRLPNGSDPERVRWDGVKLLLDLLGDNDRLLIQRFNHNCPPEYTANDIARLNSKSNRPGSQRPSLNYDPSPENGSEFSFQFDPLARSARTKLESRISYFGTAVDHGDFDVGLTGILAALKEVGKRLKRPEPGRQTVVILLTDGLDDNYLYTTEPAKDKSGFVTRKRTASEIKTLLDNWRIHERAISDQLQFYAGTQGTGAKIPIHTIGLNLENIGQIESPEHLKLARQLLASIAALSGGEFQDIRHNSHLIQGFRRLIWSQKNSWIRDFQVPANANAETSVGTYVDQRIVDVSVLGLEQDPTSKGPKNTKPPAGGMHVEWQKLSDGVTVPDPERKTGLSDSVYEYLHWGRGGLDGAGQGSSTGSLFSRLASPAWMSASLNRSANPREVWIAKQTAQQLFWRVRPRNDEPLRRLQYLPLEVEMGPSSPFNPNQFRVTARLFPVGGEGQSKESKVLAEETLILQSGLDAASTSAVTAPKSKKGSTFASNIRLATLEYDDQQLETYYSLAFTVEGLDVDQNPLEGFRLELPRHTIRVDNRLSLRVPNPVLMTRDHPQATIELDTSYPLDEELSLAVRFEPPKLNNAPLDLEHFQTPPETVVLKAGGKGEFHLELNTDRLPDPEIQYSPGKLIFSAVNEKLHLPQVEVPVRVSIDLVQVALEPKIPDLAIQDSLASSDVFAIKLSPPEQARAGIKNLKLTLVATEAVKDSDGRETPFAEGELWLQSGAGKEPLDLAKRSQVLTDAQLDGQFRLFAYPTSTKISGTYSFRIRVEGTGIDSAETTFRLRVAPPKLELKNESLTVHAVPGSKRQAIIQCRLKAGQPKDSDQISIAGGGIETLVKFANRDPAGSEVQVILNGPGAAEPVTVAATLTTPVIKPVEGESVEPAANPVTEDWTPIRIDFEIPDAIPFGRYYGKIDLVGNRVEPVAVKVDLIVNALRLEWPVQEENQSEPRWQTARTLSLLHFFDTNMKKTVRVRSELGDKLQPDLVRQRFNGPLVGDFGDEQASPTIENIRSTSDGTGLEMDLDFGNVINVVNARKPYRVEFIFESDQLGTPPQSTTFEVWYFEPKALFEN